MFLDMWLLGQICNLKSTCLIRNIFVFARKGCYTSISNQIIIAVWERTPPITTRNKGFVLQSEGV